MQVHKNAVWASQRSLEELIEFVYLFKGYLLEWLTRHSPASPTMAIYQQRLLSSWGWMCQLVSFKIYVTSVPRIVLWPSGFMRFKLLFHFTIKSWKVCYSSKVICSNISSRKKNLVKDVTFYSILEFLVSLLIRAGRHLILGHLLPF